MNEVIATNETKSEDKPPRKTADEVFTEYLVAFFGFCMVGCFAVAFILFAIKCVMWLDSGNWPAFSMLSIWNTVLPESFVEWLGAESWLGLKKILLWILNLKAIGFSLFSGVIFMVLVTFSNN